MAIPEIDLTRYCEEVSQRLPTDQMPVEPEQVLETVGGVANLYLEAAVKLGVPELRVEARDAFVSSHAERDTILQQIGNCSGVKEQERKEAIFSGMGSVLRDSFSRQERLEPGKSLFFKPFGTITVLDPLESRYELVYRDAGNGQAMRPIPPGPAEADREPLATLIHISDLHFGDRITTDETTFKWLLACLPYLQGGCAHSFQAAQALAIRVRQILQGRTSRRISACVVFTGDLSAAGRRDELIVGSTFLQTGHIVGAGDPVGLGLGAPRAVMDAHSGPGLFVIAGNHDIWQRQHPDMLALLRHHFPGHYPVAATIQTRTRPVFLYGLDSTVNSRMRHMLAHGKVNDGELHQLCELLRYNRTLGVPGLHVVCLHHPLLDPKAHQFDATLELDDRRIVAARLREAGADLVLSGHIHKAVTAMRSPEMPHHAVAGTATQQFSERNFLVYDIHGDAIHCSLWEYDKEYRRFALRVPGEHARAEEEAYFAWKQAGEPQLSSEERDRMYLEALDRVRRRPLAWAI